MRKFLLFALIVGGSLWWFKGALRSGKIQAYLDRQTHQTWAPAAQYYLASWYSLVEDLTQATTGYWRITKRFPTSSFTERAHFRMLETRERMHLPRAHVMEEHRKFLEKYPDGKFARKVRKRLELSW